MKIYRKAVIDMRTLETVEEESFEYQGPVALCGGGGGQDINSVDEAYNRRMATIAEDWNRMGQEMYNFWKYGMGENQFTAVDTTQGQYANDYRLQGILKKKQLGGEITDEDNDYIKNTYGMDWNQETGELGRWQYTPEGGPGYREMESGQIAANIELQPYETAAAKARLEGEAALTPEMTRAGIAGAQLSTMQSMTEASLLGDRAAAERANLRYTQMVQPYEAAGRMGQLQEEQALRESRAPVREMFFDETMKGIDVNRRMGAAEADVEHGASQAMQDLRDTAFRSGADPNSGNYLAEKRKLMLSKAAGIAGARTTARDVAEEQNWRRLATAGGLAGSA